MGDIPYLFPGFFDVGYYRFLFFVTALLIVLGGLLFFLQFHPSTQASAKKIWIAYKPWLIMAPLCFLSLGFSGYVLIGSLFLLCLFALKEFIRATELENDKGIVYGLYCSLALTFCSVAFNSYHLFSLLPIFLVVVFLVLPPLQDEYEGMLRKISLSIIAAIYIIWFPAHLAFFSHLKQGYLYLLFLIIGTELNDASAYLSGKLFGKHLLVPRVSPNKTIEGSLGALCAVSLYVWMAHSWVPGFTFLTSVTSILLITVGGTLGDLVMSFFKRDLGIKDLGQLIPGHGGLLDRIDSLLLIAPLYFYLLRYGLPLVGDNQ